MDTIGYRPTRSTQYSTISSRRQRPALAGQHVGPVPVELAGGRVHGDGDVRHRAPGRPPRWPRPGSAPPPRWRRRLGAKPPSSPTVVDRPRALQHPGQCVVGLDPPPQGLGERGRPHRHDHELLEVDRVVGVDPAVDHVHHGHGEHVGVGPAHVAVQRQARARRRPPWPWPATRRGWRWPRDGPCSASRRHRSWPGRPPAGRGRRSPSRNSAISPLTLATAWRTPLPP